MLIWIAAVVVVTVEYKNKKIIPYSLCPVKGFKDTSQKKKQFDSWHNLFTNTHKKSAKNFPFFPVCFIHPCII